MPETLLMIWNKSYMNYRNEMQMKMKWLSQWTYFTQLRKEALKKNSGLQRGLNPRPPDYWCDALPTELWSHWRWEQVLIVGLFSMKYYLSISCYMYITRPDLWQVLQNNSSIIIWWPCRDNNPLIIEPIKFSLASHLYLKSQSGRCITHNNTQREMVWSFTKSTLL